MKYVHMRTITTGLLLTITSLSYAGIYSYQDDFNDGVIDATFWNTSGDGISESGGYLNLSRNNSLDSISSINSYSGYFDITIDITLDNSVYNDFRHGIALLDNTKKYGISFGFQTINKFYCSIHNGTLTTTYPQVSSFTVGTPYSIRLQSDENSMSIYANDNLQIQTSFNPNREYYVFLPGDYFDLDGAGVGDNNTTDSRVDNFNFTVESIPEPSSIILLSMGSSSIYFIRKASRRHLRNRI